MELYFGLGAADAAEDVTITWADGTTTDLGAGRRATGACVVTPEGDRRRRPRA